MNGDKILFILDDMWNGMKLHEASIPCGKKYKNSKILITCRKESVCKDMKAEKISYVNPLPSIEAWTLFERVVGKDEWDDKLKEVALDVVNECGGLPMFLEAVGNALKDKEIEIWEAELKQLRDPTNEDLPYKKDGIMQLKLSYNHLDNDFVKSCFSLCGLFPEDYTIDLGDLTDLVLVLERVNNLNGNVQLQDVKGSVQLAIDTLISSSLLLPIVDKDEERKICFKMHDLVRDMAILVNSSKYSVQSGMIEWQPGRRLESYVKISLIQNKIDKVLNHELHFPHLDTFLACYNSISFVADEFFEGMERVEVLDMSCNKISNLPLSLNKLKKLQTLDLSGNRSLCDVSILGELTCLVIVRLRSTGIRNIPKEIGQLHNLRLLDAYHCEDLSYVTVGVIAKLIRLEELYLEIKEEGDYSFIVELSELKSLKILHLRVPELHTSLNDFPYESLIEYDFGNDYEHPSLVGFVKAKRCLSIADDSFPLNMQVVKLIHKSDALRLSGIRNLDSILPDLYPTTASSKSLRVISLDKCENVTCMVRTCGMETSVSSNEVGPMKKPYNMSMEGKELRYMGSFCNLMAIYIYKCNSLLELFPSSVAQGLVNLRRLTIEECESLVVVVSAGDEQTDAARGEIELVTHDTEDVFVQLTHISFHKLPKLRSFYSGNSIIKYPSLKSIEVKNCGSLRRWSYGENHLPPNIKFEHQGNQYSNINNFIAEIQHESEWKLKVSTKE